MSGLSVSGDDWPARFFEDADSLQLDRLGAWFADDVDIRLANMPPITGRAAGEEAFRQFWSSLIGMSHRREIVVVDGDDAVQGSQVTYTRPDGSAATMPVASHLRRNAAGQLLRLWIYIDLAPLFAPADAEASA